MAAPGKIKIFLFSVTTLLLSLCLLELLLQGVLLLRHANAPAVGLLGLYRWDPLMNYSLNPGYSQDTPYQVRINAQGERTTSTPMENAQTIIVMGGSTTFCPFISDQEAWPTVLESTLRQAGHRVNVHNLGIPSQHSNHHIARFARDVAPLHPDLIILYLNVNDMFPMYQDLHGKPRDMKTLDGVGGEHMNPPTPFALVKFARFLGTRIDEIHGSLFSHGLEKNQFLTEAARTWVPDNACMQHYRDNIRTLLHLTQQCGAKAVFILPPWIFNSEQRIASAAALPRPLFLYDNAEIPHYFTPRLRWREKQYPILLDIPSLGGSIIDMRNIFEADIAANLQAIKHFAYDGSHFTALGASRFGTQVARQIVADKLLDLNK